MIVWIIATLMGLGILITFGIIAYSYIKEDN